MNDFNAFRLPAALASLLGLVLASSARAARSPAPTADARADSIPGVAVAKIDSERSRVGERRFR